MTLGMEGSGLAQVGMEMIEIQNQLVASEEGRDGGLIQSGRHIFFLFRPLSPFILKPQVVGSGLVQASAWREIWVDRGI